jgi:hypothetical protein
MATELYARSFPFWNTYAWQNGIVRSDVQKDTPRVRVDGDRSVHTEARFGCARYIEGQRNGTSLHQSAPPHLARMIRTCLRSWITAETITGMPGRAAAWRSRARKEMAQISRPGICLPAPFLGRATHVMWIILHCLYDLKLRCLQWQDAEGRTAGRTRQHLGTRKLDRCYSFFPESSGSRRWFGNEQ